METGRVRAASPYEQASDDVNMSYVSPYDPAASPPSETDMAPRVKKPLTLTQIREEGFAFREAAMPVRKGSAFDTLTQKNIAFVNDPTRRDRINKESAVQMVIKRVMLPSRISKLAKKKKHQVAKKPEATPIVPKEPVPIVPKESVPIVPEEPVLIVPKEPVVEFWRTAKGTGTGAEVSNIPTRYLEIARVPTWKEDDFKAALRAMLLPLGGAEELGITIHDCGGEFYSEIAARFVTKNRAQFVMDNINGALILGRKLQVFFAVDF